jgi:GDPmannose 4,6-dehydratase
MLQLEKAEDFVLATGETHTIREFADKAFRELDMELEWVGSGIDEKGIEKKTGQTRVKIDPRYYRPTEVELLLGDSTKAKKSFGWNPQIKFGELVELMIKADWEKIQKRGGN